MLSNPPKMRWLFLISFTLVSTVIPETSGSKILFISAVCAKSQKGFFDAIAHTLAQNGHHVTMVSTHKLTRPHPNIRDIYLEGLDITSTLPNLFTANALSGPGALMRNAPKICSDALARKEVQDLLKEDFDLGMMSVVFNDCFISAFHQLRIPFIQVCPLVLAPPAATTVGNPFFSSFIHSPFLHVYHPFTFPQRLLNTVFDTFGVKFFINVVVSNIDAECRSRGLCPESLGSLTELRDNASLIFVNSVKTAEDPPRPNVPAVIHVGGLHCHEPKPLSQDLENWIAGAGEDGFIFFSLGSVVTPSSMPKEYLKILLEAFGLLKQRVLWKWDQDTVEGLPSNIRLGKWLPQQDILGHPKLKLFITHGGALSTQESMYHGIPVLGLPVFADQLGNMLEAQVQGWGLVLKWEELTPQIVKDSIISVMNSEKMRSEVQRRSNIMKDLPLSPAQEIIFWTEYVLRHKGAPHLRSPTLSMPWYQLYNVDVWTTIVGIFLLAIYICFRLLVAICSSLCSSKPKRKRA